MHKLDIKGVFEITSTCFEDERGFFLNIYRSYEGKFLETWGSNPIVQINLSHTKTVGSIRGLHYQLDPYSEAKLVRCLKGKVWDVIVDLRQDSNTYGRWCSLELSGSKANSVFIPPGCAHGFQVLEESSELLYLHSQEWKPKYDTGIRWDDPTLSIAWPMPISQISEKDKNLPLFK